ncbi:MAG: DUF6150 family protein [Pseudomonadota bacterium]|nr:DUF6150 family protein [Pseudomonadota bacterium]
MAKIHVVKQAYEADVVAFKVLDEREADILVFVEPGGARAMGDARWFYVGKFQATTKLFWASPEDVNVGDSNALKVFFVHEESEAKWMKDHVLRGQL